MQTINDLILQSKEIYYVALATYKPKAVVMMFSGGDDSLTTYHVAKQLGIKFDAVIFGNTRTGIEETTSFVIQEMVRNKENLIMADAKNSYVDYIMRKGFFGKGDKAHNYSYHVLKHGHFRREVSLNIRKRKRDFPILFINGARRKESKRREVSMLLPYRLVEGKNNIWVNLINEWDKPDCRDFLAGCGIQRNPVSIVLCRSGECMCGTMQSAGDRIEASFFFPKWGKWLDSLEKAAVEKHGFGWNESKVNVPKISNTLDQPMCTGCKVAFEQNIN